MDKKEIGKNIKEIRKTKNLTREDLKEKLNLSYSSIEKYEQGLRNFNLKTLRKFADALDVSIYELMGDLPMEKHSKNLFFETIKENQVNKKDIHDYTVEEFTSNELKEKIKSFLDNDLITLDEIVEFQLLSEKLVNNSLLNEKDKKDFIRLCNLMVDKWCENMSNDEISKLENLYLSKKNN
ncbi:hypothetical protein UT300002_31430 [Clostridium perfringens]|nr:helix-turn-helix transcriptional regulator [Clostridium perfringens]